MPSFRANAKAEARAEEIRVPEVSKMKTGAYTPTLLMLTLVTLP